jgi:hypothetical protein
MSRYLGLQINTLFQMINAQARYGGGCSNIEVERAFAIKDLPRRKVGWGAALQPQFVSLLVRFVTKLGHKHTVT